MERNAGVAADELTIRLDDHTEARPIRMEDAGALFEVIDRNRERLGRWLPWATPDYSMADTLRFCREQVAENAAGKSLAMTIRHRGSLCGAIALHRFDERNHSTSMGYWLDEAHEGRGIITAACRAMLTEGFGRFGLHRIEIRCATGNRRSSPIPRRLEFVEEGILREAERLHGQWVNLRVFSMLAEDWKRGEKFGAGK